MSAVKGTPKNKTAARAAEAAATLKQVDSDAKGKTSNAKISESMAKFLADMEKKGLIGNINKPIDFISTGNWVIDRCVGDGKGGNGPGGFPRGFMVEVFGKESTGKSTLCLQAIPGLQAQKELTVYGDFEKSLRAQQHYIRNMGIDVTDKSTFLHLEPNTLEEGTEAIFNACVALKPAMVVVDSLAAMQPAAFLTGKVEEAIKVGLHARMVSVFVGTMNKILGKTNTSLVFINQLRAKIGAATNGPQTDTTGGFAFKFYMALRIQLAQVEKVGVTRNSEITGDSNKEYTDQVIKVTIVKNKLDRPFRSECVYLRFNRGFDGVQSLIDIAQKRKVLEGSSWLSYISPTDPSLNFKLNGREKVYQHLSEHPEIIDDMMPLLFPKVDVGEMVVAKQNGEIEEDALPEDMQDLLKEMSKGFTDLNADPSQESELEMPEG
jgi:recombination protein RecA